VLSKIKFAKFKSNGFRSWKLLTFRHFTHNPKTLAVITEKRSAEKITIEKT